MTSMTVAFNAFWSSDVSWMERFSRSKSMQLKAKCIRVRSKQALAGLVGRLRLVRRVPLPDFVSFFSDSDHD